MCAFTDGDNYRIILKDAEIGSAIYGDFIFAGSEADEGVAAFVIGQRCCARLRWPRWLP